MNILPFLDLLEAGFTPHKDSKCKAAFNTINNNSLNLCFSKKYIEYIEKNTLQLDRFQNLIKELYDSNRIRIFNPPESKCLESEFISLYKMMKEPKLISVAFRQNKNLLDSLLKLIVVELAEPINYHWVNLELFTKNSCNVTYKNFTSDKEIGFFFKEIFGVPKYLSKVTIYDREINSHLLDSLKGSHIHYYTFCNYKMNQSERKENLRILKSKLGGKVKLYYTTNARLIHERKIIFEDIIMTLDNSRSNINVNEPTWEIFLNYDPIKVNYWQQKCVKFKNVED